MKTLPIVACMAVAFSAVAYDLTEDPLREEAFNLISADGSIRARIAAMSAEKKRAMLEYVRLQYTRDKDKSFELSRILLFLGDEATYQEMLQKNDYGSLQATLDPHIFELIAPIMFRSDKNFLRQEFVFPPSIRARNAIVWMLWQMPEVPKSIKDWNDWSSLSISESEMQQIFRDWWTANEAAWRRRDFAALKPGRDMSHRNIYKMREDVLAREAAAAALNATTTPQSKPSPQPTSAFTLPSPATDSTQRRPKLGIVLLVLVAIGISLWVFRSRSQS